MAYRALASSLPPASVSLSLRGVPRAYEAESVTALDSRAPLDIFMPEERTIGFVPTFEVRVSGGSLILTADLPGVHSEDVHVSAKDGRLVVTGERRGGVAGARDMYLLAERSYGTFNRAFLVPEDFEADEAYAELEGGVLTITVPPRRPSEVRAVVPPSR